MGEPLEIAPIEELTGHYQRQEKPDQSVDDFESGVRGVIAVHNRRFLCLVLGVSEDTPLTELKRLVRKRGELEPKDQKVSALNTGESIDDEC